MRRARTYPRRYRAPSTVLGIFFVVQSSADCTTNMSGFDLRQAQLVKRGDTIKRGQMIARSGQSGEVGSPRLHVEIRKGSSPVDPRQFLNGA